MMKRKGLNILFWIIVLVLISIAIIGYPLAEWFDMTFGVTLEALLFTLTSPLEGSDTGFLAEAIEYITPSIYQTVIYICVCVILCFVFSKIKIIIKMNIEKFRLHINCYRLFQIIMLVIMFSNLYTTIKFCDDTMAISDYVKRKYERSTVYEEYYVNPNDVSITAESQKKNIIYIYLESMETSYASEKDGGALGQNYIPNLTTLAQENINFSNKGQLGGAKQISGAGWTMGALFSSTTGIPFSFPVDGNSMDSYEKFAPNVMTLGDFLYKEGYQQVFLCGSDGNFAGRQKYFEQHGNYKVLDYFYAIEEEYIPKDYRVWWGYEDEHLYKIAKDKLLELASTDQLFNFTMLTVDTHHVDGYVCEGCGEEYPEQLGNVLACADRQVGEFINWCKEQEFYEDTVIVITGDHLRMDNSMVGEVEDRRIYNCIINSDTQVEGQMKNREFAMIDIFPTTLAAMGYSIEGNRLGLGTNLFSKETTLAEELGVDVLNEELSKYSKFYKENFE